MSTIETPRILLRDIHLTDARAFQALLGDVDVVRFLEYGPYDELQTHAWLSQVIITKYDVPRRVYHFAIVDRATDDVAGWIAIATVAPSTAEWGLSFALRREYWGQGLATEAVRALVDHAFREFVAHRIYAEVDPENAASARVVAKCGFLCEGRLRSKIRIRGEWRDVLLYSTLEETPA